MVLVFSFMFYSVNFVSFFLCFTLFQFLTKEGEILVKRGMLMIVQGEKYLGRVMFDVCLILEIY